jgi:hypothetical protein
LPKRSFRRQETASLKNARSDDFLEVVSVLKKTARIGLFLIGEMIKIAPVNVKSDLAAALLKIL